MPKDPEKIRDEKIEKIKELAKKQIEKDLKSIERKYRERLQKIKLKKDKKVMSLFRKLDDIHYDIDFQHVRNPQPEETRPYIEKICQHILGIKTVCKFVNDKNMGINFVLLDEPDKNYLTMVVPKHVFRETYSGTSSALILREIGRYIFRNRTIPKLVMKDKLIALIIGIITSVISMWLIKKKVQSTGMSTGLGALIGIITTILVHELLYRKLLRKHKGPEERLIDHIVTYYGYGERLADIKKYGMMKRSADTGADKVTYMIKKIFSKSATPEECVCLIYAQMVNSAKKGSYDYAHYNSLLYINDCDKYF